MTTAITDRLNAVRERIAVAEKRAGRPAGSVKLVAVSKKMPAAAMREAYVAGQRDFGENYIQELLEKRSALSDLSDLVIHLIGHVQSNKARHAARLADVIHTIDDTSLARELGKRCETMERKLPVLLEVNIGREPQKHGVMLESLEPLADAVRAESTLELRGLMTVPPHTEDPEGARPYFAQLREAAHRLGLAELSMGMTHDMEIAIEEGATIVRVGTAIFGERT